ncbi:MAG: amidohydrolase [Desulfovibrionaceae bacterium]
MADAIHHMLQDLEPDLIGFRRALHAHAESGWTEFWTTDFIAAVLEKAGYRVTLGKAVMDASARMGLPDDATLDAAARRAVEEGADPDRVALMRGGFTGLVADLRPEPAPTIALRFDIDALPMAECAEDGHRPARDGFASRHACNCHACGHDGNSAIGLGLALALAKLGDRIPGNVRLIFQPAEEGVRGALPMVKAGVVDGVRAFLSCHVGFKALHTGEIILGTSEFLATSKFDVTYTGVSSHAGAFPEEGKNALLAAAAATLNLHAIPRHSGGATRITVGRLDAGEGRNIIPSRAFMRAETRGETTALNEYMLDKAKRVLEHAAQMYDVGCDFQIVGGCGGGYSDPAMVAVMRKTTAQVPFFKEELVREHVAFGASDDVSEFMNAVQAQGGIASYAMIGTELAAGHHNFRFDFNEAVIAPAAELLVRTVLELGEG